MQAGKDLDLNDDRQILQINSPKTEVGGPYKVIYKNIPDRWAIVAFSWNNTPHLGMRWFWGTSGTPSSRNHSTWLIIPSELQNALLNSLPLDFQFRDRLNEFLSGRMDGEMLSEHRNTLSTTENAD